MKCIFAEKNTTNKEHSGFWQNFLCSLGHRDVLIGIIIETRCSQLIGWRILLQVKQAVLSLADGRGELKL